MTERYHYIFDAPTAIVATLGSSFHKDVSGVFYAFNVGDGGATDGYYRLVLPAGVDEVEREEAIAAGYSAKRTGALQLEGHLVGKRFPSGGIQPIGASKTLNRTYEIDVIEQLSSLDKETRDTLTPVKATVDGALGIAGVGLLLVGWPFLVVIGAIDHALERSH